MSRRDALAVIAKEPVAGTAKTRLAPALGTTGAARAAAAMLADTVAVVRAVGADPWLCFTPPRARDGSAAWRPDSACSPRDPATWATVWPPAWPTCWRPAPSGSRSSRPTPPTSRRPAADGRSACSTSSTSFLGLPLTAATYLVAAKAADPGLFVGVPMGTEVVLAETLARVARRGLTAALLPPLRDLDRVEDLAFALAAGELADAPATRAVATELLAGVAATTA
jgi:hypothetical protein